MSTLRVTEEDNAYVIHFESDLKRINAYTLASTLVALADAAKAANAAINPGYDVEVVVGEELLIAMWVLRERKLNSLSS